MKYVLMCVGFAAWTIATYNVGFSACEFEYVSNNEKLYKQQLHDLRLKQSELVEQVQTYQRAAAAVRIDAERLRTELRSATMQRANNQPRPAGGNSCGRDEKMATVLDRATDFVAERDEIALKYNELKEQCKVKP